MPTEPEPEDPEIPPILLQAGRLFGLSPIQVRWKILAFHRKWKAFRDELTPAERRFEHQICGECGAVQPHEAIVCGSCGDKLASPAARFFRSVGLSVPTFLSVSSILGIACILIYFRMMMLWKAQGFLAWEMEALIAHGGLWPPAVFHQGQWWRVGTANFLHIGIWHIFFNIAGLSQVGPTVEEVYGRARMVFFFALTGVIAMTASAVAMPMTPTAGASGALMGLIGITAGWGHRRKTSLGREIRDQMIKWGIYTMLFGIFVNANHVAHAAGFISGALLGLAFNPERLEKTKTSTPSLLMGVLGAIACAACVVLTLAPPASSRALAEKFRRTDDNTFDEREIRAQFEDYRQGTLAACRMLAEGKRDEAIAKLAEHLGDEIPDKELDAMCIYVRRASDQCELYLSDGLSAVLTPEEKSDSDRGLTIEAYFEMWCEPH